MTTRVLFILDQDRRREEESAFIRLAIGLAADGLRPAVVLPPGPEDQLADVLRNGPVPVMFGPVDAPFWIRARAARSTLEALRELGFDDFEAVVSCGRGAQPMAEEIGDQLEIPVIHEVRTAREAAGIRIDGGHVVTTPNERLQVELERRFGEGRVAMVPVPVPRTPHTPRRNSGLAIAMGPVLTSSIWRALIDGLAGPEGPVEGLNHLAVELDDGRKDQLVWKHLRSSSLSNRMSSFDRVDRMRNLLTGADVVICPESRMAVRSIEIQAVLQGSRLVAVESMVREDRGSGLGAKLVGEDLATDPAAWREAIRSSLAAQAPTTGRHAAEHSLVSRVAPRWHRLIDTVVHGDATPIESAVS